MPPHIFQVGDLVSFQADDGQSFSRLNPFTIEAQMPHLGDKLQYRIKSEAEAFRRVAPEHRITDFGAQPSTRPPVDLGIADPGVAIEQGA